MKAFSSFGFFLILATFLFLSSAFPQEGKTREGDDNSGLIGSAIGRGHATPLRRKPPPGKVPGPQLTAADDDDNDDDNSRSRNGGKGGRGRKGASLYHQNPGADAPEYVGRETGRLREEATQ